MKLTTAEAIRELDGYAINDLELPGAFLMASAAGHVAAAAMELLPPGGYAVCFCGVGNNGGDGIGASVSLITHGVPVRVFLVGDEAKLTADSREMLRRLREHGADIEQFAPSRELEELLSGCGVIIDAMLGVGINSDLRGDILTATGLINASERPVVAADIPTGVDADSGRILGSAVRADVTVTFSLAKRGHFIEPGCTMCGDVRVRDIGIPSELIANAQSDVCAVMPEDISLPRRRADAHKGDFGRCLIVAGSVGYTGAPVLAARAASRAGAGLVTLAVPEAVYPIAAIKCGVEMAVPLPDAGGTLAGKAKGEIVKRLAECDVCLIGPGLGRSAAVSDIVRAALKKSTVPLILDADGINGLTGNIDVLDEARCPVVLTPHMGEFCRLPGVPEVTDRLGAAVNFAAKHGVILVLKGHRTITALPDGTAFVNTTGGPALAKGGTGDVLAGMITAFIGQKFPIKDAVLAAVYLHGMAGDLCALELGEYSVTAEDVIEALAKVLKNVIRR